MHLDFARRSQELPNTNWMFDRSFQIIQALSSIGNLNSSIHGISHAPALQRLLTSDPRQKFFPVLHIHEPSPRSRRRRLWR